ncbi:hypothetical protein NL676_018237, partial [Syzygium grande]
MGVEWGRSAEWGGRGDHDPGPRLAAREYALSPVPAVPQRAIYLVWGNNALRSFVPL